MSKYRINEASRTTTSTYTLVAGLLAGHFLSAQAAPAPVEIGHEALPTVPYRTKAALSSFDQYRNVFGHAPDRRPDPFIEGISSFYTRLAGSQEPLAPEFSRVLYANLWDLYER